MPPHHPVLDPAVAYPKINELRAALDARDWTACRALLDAAEPVERGFLIDAAAEAAEVAGFLRGVRTADPADSTAAALLGRHLTVVAGSAERWRAAEIELIDAAARAPDDPAVWAARLGTARLLGLGQSEARRRYDRLAAIDPHFLPGQSGFARQLCPQWGGDWDRAHEFARSAAEAAPPGSLSHVLIAEVHIEHWLALRDTAARRTYLAADAVRSGLYDAAKSSVWHADFRRTHGWVHVMNVFAVAFALLDDMPAVASLFTALDGLATGWPWSCLGDPVTVISQYAERALPDGGAA
ncbi:MULTISPECIES: hypothetical protein [unclassified Actinoplanes]|uniref:hypothetical protein n=1 Tax=unclassified Actinoplanes TaxID=2626549 RepID=UPI0005B92D3B|nr:MULTISPECIES: hypothetical protein [unclassified Actinoplanes]